MPLNQGQVQYYDVIVLYSASPLPTRHAHGCIVEKDLEEEDGTDKQSLLESRSQTPNVTASNLSIVRDDDVVNQS